MSKLQVWGKSH